MNGYSKRLIAKATRARFFGESVDVLLINKSLIDGHTAISIGMPIVFKEVKDEEQGLEPLPTLNLPQDTAQQLMDELWHVGIRPTEGTGSAGAMAATQKHLEDMRTLVFKK